MKHLHIVGCPRSGTTLLMELISTCFASAGYCEHEKSIFEAPDVDGEPYFTKQPNDIKQLSHIFHRDPELYIIYMGRDPRSVITSLHDAEPGVYFCNYRVWSECDRAAQRYLGHARFLAVSYESLVAQPDAMQDRIAQQFTFLQRRHPFSQYHLHAKPSLASERAMHGLREVNPDSLSKWLSHLPRLAEQFQRHPALAADLTRLGYEDDDAWLSMLQEIEPKVFPCRYPERRQYMKEWEKALRVYLKSRRYLRRIAAA
ncbi:MAG: sulfotransferase [Pseudomonadota bacterium]